MVEVCLSLLALLPSVPPSRAIERPNDRATERSTEHPSDRATERSSDLANGRATERTSDRAIDRSTERAGYCHKPRNIYLYVKCFKYIRHYKYIQTASGSGFKRGLTICFFALAQASKTQPISEVKSDCYARIFKISVSNITKTYMFKLRVANANFNNKQLK